MGDIYSRFSFNHFSHYWRGDNFYIYSPTPIALTRGLTLKVIGQYEDKEELYMFVFKSSRSLTGDWVWIYIDKITIRDYQFFT